jgi:hypothetical protein
MIDVTKEVELVDLVEASVIADLQLDAEIARCFPKEHDSPEMKGQDDPDHRQSDSPAEFVERDYSITVTAEDRGDYKGAPGAGIKIVGVSIEIQKNVGDGDNKFLPRLCSRISDRLPATQMEDKSRHQAFCNSRLLVYGIMSNEVERRNDVDLTRERVINREFLCAQIS